MYERPLVGGVLACSYFLIHMAFVARAILRPHREPASRIAWVAVMFGLPVIGIVAYVLLGEARVLIPEQLEEEARKLLTINGYLQDRQFLN